MSERWLVIAHEATNTGAPRMLLEVLRAVRAARGPGWSCEILLNRGGSLAGEFAEFGRVRPLSHWWAEGSGLVARGLHGLIDRPWLKPGRMRRWAQAWYEQGGGIIYSNTATNGRLLAALPNEKIRVITHVHELDYGMRRFNRPQDLAVTLSRTDFFFAASSAVLADLRALGVAADQMQMLPNFLPNLPAVPDKTVAHAEVCRRLQLNSNTRIIVGCGYLDSLKGTDLFTEMAVLVAARMTEQVAFIWLGGKADRAFEQRVRAMAQGSVRFTGEVADVGLYFAASEVVTVTSRVESFSRVALEAGSLGRPVLAYSAARGPVDLLMPELLVSELSAAAMAESLLRLLLRPEEARQLGERLRERIGDNFLAEQWIGPLLSAVEEVGRA